MATIRETHVGDTTGRCTICDRPAAGYWTGHTGGVATCYSCAVGVLPALLADSLPYATPAYVHGAAERMLTTYWRAIALRLLRERDADARRREGGAA